MMSHDDPAGPSASQMAKTYPASVIRKVFERVAAFDDVTSLTVGEPDFDTPTHIVDAAVESLRAGDTRYTPNAGIPELRDAVAQLYSEQWGRPLKRENVVVTVGGQEDVPRAAHCGGPWRRHSGD